MLQTINIETLPPPPPPFGRISFWGDGGGDGVCGELPYSSFQWGKNAMINFIQQFKYSSVYNPLCRQDV